MQATQSNTSKVSFILALAINKEVVEAEISFLVPKNLWQNGSFYDIYST